MARTKNRGLQQSFSPSYTVRRWRLGEHPAFKEDLKERTTATASSSTSVICSMTFTRSISENLKVFPNM